MPEVNGLATVVLGLALARWMQLMGIWLAHRRWIIYPSVPLWWAGYWALAALHRLLFGNAWLALLEGGLLLLLLPLVLPDANQLDRSNPYTYLDAYENLRQQRHLVFGLALLPLLLGLLWWPGPLDGSMLLWEGLPLLLALRTDHKGAMLLWVSLAWGGLWWRWSSSLGF